MKGVGVRPEPKASCFVQWRDFAPDVKHDDDARALTYKIASLHASQISAGATVASKAFEWTGIVSMEKLCSVEGEGGRQCIHPVDYTYVQNRASAVVERTVVADR